MNQNLVLQLIRLYRQQSFDSGSPPTPDQWDTLEEAAKGYVDCSPAAKKRRLKEIREQQTEELLDRLHRGY